VVVSEDQLSLAIGKRGQNVRLAARLTGWDVDILTPKEFNTGLDNLEQALRKVSGVDSTIVDKVAAMGMVNVLDVEEVGPEPFINELGIDRDIAQAIVVSCAEEARRVAEEQQAAKEAKAREASKPAEKAEKAPADRVPDIAPAADTPAPEAPAQTPGDGEAEVSGQAASTAGVETSESSGELPAQPPGTESQEAAPAPQETQQSESADQAQPCVEPPTGEAKRQEPTSG
jgi:N utilization substance protein A